MPENSDRNECRKFESTLGTVDILHYFANGRPFHTAQEVADAFDVDRSTANRRLSQLADERSLEKVALGHRTVVWWYRANTPSAPPAVASDDPLWSAPTFTVDEPIDDGEIDDVIYGDIEG
jgi:hypothetical protein